jgi:2-hydroxychromene-2-carboxylate isomerase|tara:strand:+ start:475 stop:1089 length:615 start_codon:yes stop_codon:yes gene_type:complete
MMNVNYIEFFFDCSSPWTYLSFSALKDLAEENNIEIQYRPILVGGIFNTVNPSVYKSRENPIPAKEKYYLSDIQNWAMSRDIIINWPSIFPINSVKAMRGCLYAESKNISYDFALDIFKAYWTYNKDISSDKVLEDICLNRGLDPLEFFEFIKMPSTKLQLIKNSEDLIEKGGFGSPTFFYQDKMFFGNDRLDLLSSLLNKDLI